MGKSKAQQEPSITLEHGNPGCMKGIFHRFNHHKWHNVRKRLPHKRNSGGKFASGVVVEDPGNSLNKTNAGEVQDKLTAETAKSSIHAKSSDSGSGHKSSMKSRIKALISEEVNKRRGRHCRSSSYPTRIPLERKPERKPSIHHLDVSCPEPCAEIGLSNNESLDHHHNLLHSPVSILLDPLLPQICGEPVTHSRTCHLCAAMLTKNYLRQSEVNEHGKQPVKDHTLLQDQLIYAIEPSKFASLEESKLFLNALDLLNIRKELFLKVLQDPNSSLSHHLHSQKASSLRLGLTKSMSFPVPGSLGKCAPASNSPKSKKECGCCTEGVYKPQVEEYMSSNSLASEDLDQNLATNTGKHTEDEEPKQLYPQDNSLGSPKEFKNRHVNKLIMKRFKNLREKIKHAIKESRKERKRIVMDAVLHKIPYGYPKDVKEEDGIHKDVVTQNWNKYSRGNDQYSASGKIGQHGIRRTSSFNESINRYNRLLEVCFNMEANSRTSDRSKLKTTGTPSSLGGSPLCLGRILSLPDLRSYSFSRIERSAATNSLETPIRPLLGRSLSKEKTSVVEQKPIASENQIQLDSPPDNDSRENLLEVDDSLTNLVGSETRKSIPDRDDVIEPTTDFGHGLKFEEDAMATKGLEVVPEDLISEEEDSLLNLQHVSSMEFRGLHESNININIDKVETSRKQSYNGLLHVKVDMKNKAEFNYVRDVLELSGFSGTECLGKWHSEEQPVDPLVFEEVEGCLLAQPICSGNEEGGSCNHLLLFDLINEVLLEIYERTFSYWPMPLTCRSHVHPMPVGYHVLEDVWANINWYLSRRPEVDQSLDDAVSHDLSKSDGWMNIQFEAECVGLELEDLIFDDLLEELVLT